MGPEPAAFDSGWRIDSLTPDRVDVNPGFGTPTAGAWLADIVWLVPTGHLRFLRRDLGIRTPMRTMGVIATGLLVVLGVTVGVLGIASIPDIKRYIKIHEM